MSIAHLLRQSKNIIDHHRELEEIKGEQFNIFSILNVEAKENQTHSAFLAELLNPKGSHLKGSKFLELFFEFLPEYPKSFEFKNAKISREVSAGKVDFEGGIGGRLDIVISDNTHTICIENKIHAGDQYKQILRYYNYFGGKATILYLTKFGTNPTENSCGDLVEGEDFHLLSYKNDINNWLESCIKESHNSPILRESLRQYQLLIRKLTGTMDKSEEEKLHQLILLNLHEAEIISQNVAAAKVSIAQSFRNELIAILKEDLPNGFNIYAGDPANKNTSQIWIKPDSPLLEGFYFGIESFSVVYKNHHDGKLFIGCFYDKGNDKTIRAKYTNDFDWFSDWWFDILVFDDFDNTSVDFSKTSFIKKLAEELPFRKGLLEYITKNASIYIQKQIGIIEAIRKLP